MATTTLLSLFPKPDDGLEREAEMHLFAAAIGHAKNPTSHRDEGTTAPEVPAEPFPRNWLSRDLVMDESQIVGLAKEIADRAP